MGAIGYSGPENGRSLYKMKTENKEPKNTEDRTFTGPTFIFSVSLVLISGFLLSTFEFRESTLVTPLRRHGGTTVSFLLKNRAISCIFCS